ncbi:hypothetical protein ACMYUM_29845 (plasmid) [Priestia megaterium]|uniref:hypothetical protein n=1 Tax=Priestia megaterium TaxID=1404 RepID=UPI00263EB640|nr:hypothetical protein [Sphingomonas sp. PsM26]
MKNHVYQNGRLIQTNKKFSALKQKQKEGITNELRQRYISTINYPHIKLHPRKRDQISDEVYDLIEEKEIWTLYGEVKRHYFSKIPSFIRKNRKMMQQEENTRAITGRIGVNTTSSLC